MKLIAWILFFNELYVKLKMSNCHKTLTRLFLFLNMSYKQSQLSAVFPCCLEAGISHFWDVLNVNCYIT